ncbi:LysR substrate-binding domain-containing protein [Aquabacter sp. CN5-332]|uniref:LysR substrate-binding domain-containing protein n=1 Tax=Aquabacter sp. CN5-332 TaxID=3156608 RepID=UPI0032B5AF83
MDTRFLQSFVSVADHGSLAEAARRLNLTPAAVAQRIRALEAELGTPLIGRSGRMVRPTEAGAAILERARALLREVRALTFVAEGSALAGELRIGAIATALTGFIPDIMREMTTRHPALEIYIEPGTSVELYQMVMDGELDAAILIQPNFALPKTCVFTVLREEPLIVIAPQSASSRDPIALLSTEPFIRYDRKHWGGRLADDYLRRRKLQPAERFELDALDAIAVMVDRGLGVSLVPDWSPPWPEKLSLLKIPVPGPAPVRRVGLLWKAASPRIAGVNALVAASKAAT